MATSDLPWLPPPPEGFRAACHEVNIGDGAGLRALATHALDLNQLTTLSKSIDKTVQSAIVPPELTPVRLALLGNGTTSLLTPALISSAVRHGILLEVIEAPYDQAMQAALDPSSEINSCNPDVALLAFDHRILSVPSSPTDPTEAAANLEMALDQLDAIRNGLAGSGATVMFQTIPPPPAPLIGSFDLKMPGSTHALTDALNKRLFDLVNGTGDLVLDVAGIAGKIGLDRWHDATQWNIAKITFSPSAVPLYAEHVSRLLGALKGKSRKCLVLDLDNTLWGGVIGDDGMAGIVLGQGNPIGEAFLDLQRAALQLRALGTILAVCSKNDDAVAREPFRSHPDMLLRESDIAVFQANWSDKATNLEAIASALDIGIDALVFLDDNPAERAQVRQALPKVAVPELPYDPALYARTLLSAGYFESVSLSREDLLRADDYAARAKRVELQKSTRDLGSYLASLEMEISFQPFDEAGRPRIAQLINKSNQFNLTTARYSENEIAAMETEPSVHTLQVRLRDRFGDNGMISVIICRETGPEWEIDTWLMSCRVLGRGVEDAVLAEIVRRAREAGASQLVGRYIPSGRNGLVRDHYANLGFAPDGDLWRLDLNGFSSKPVHMTVAHPKAVSG